MSSQRETKQAPRAKRRLTDALRRSPALVASGGLLITAVVLLAPAQRPSAQDAPKAQDSGAHPLAVQHRETPKTISFNRDIRPILSDKCFACHGPDNEHRAADLRLDVTEDTDDYAGAYFAIEPGAPGASELISRIHHKKSKFVMPPADSGLELTANEKKLLEQWIKEGATYEQHWAFLPPKSAPLPQVKDNAWSKNAIDTHVLAELERQGLKPSPAAAKHTLIRRLTFDLTGLPPTVQEVDAFLNDTSDNAYEKLVDRLLASPRFGERMAVPWLDAARYADTNGFSIDDHRDMWLWREWVIDAYNRNMPYDKFLIEQVAGDLLPKSTPKQQLATGFLRNSMNTHEGGTIPEEYRVIYIADKIDTVSSVFMGLTMRCAQCHDHKYDPLSQKEFFELYAFFDTAHEPGMGATNANTPPIIRTDGPITKPETYLKDLDDRIATLNRYLMHPPELIEARAAWEAEAAAEAQGDLALALQVPAEERTDAHWEAINTPFAKTTRLWGRHLSTIKREIIVLEKERKAGQASVMVMKEKGPKQTYVLTRGDYDKPDKNRPVDPGVPAVLPRLEMPKVDKPANTKQAKQTNPWADARWVWDNAKAGKVDQDNQPRYFRFEFELDEQPSKAVLRATADNRCTTFINGKKLGTNDPWMTPAQYDVSKQLNQGKNIIAIEAVNAGGVAGLLASLVIDGEQTIGTDKSWKVSTNVKGQWTALGYDDSKWAAAAELGPATMGPWKIDKGQATPQHDPNKPTRLHLAQWLAQPDHPLTARVAVNRTWQMLFGRGLVATLNDFGNQGAYPTHPELLDQLALDFAQNGWDTKRLVKSMVMSATYQQSSDVSAAMLERDPNNALLARMARLRLPAEFIRDSALAMAGQLDPRIGGPSVYPDQPHGLWREVSHFGYGNAFTAQAFYPSQGSDLNRRSLYTFWKRTSPPPSLVAFDAPTREVCTVERSRTNTPLQALVLLNDPEYFGAAIALATLAIDEGGDTDAEKIDYLFRRAVSRPPSAGERQIVLELLASAMNKYQRGQLAAKEITPHGTAKHAAWTIVASTILNLDEAITRE